MLLFSGSASVKGLAPVTGYKGERCTVLCNKYRSSRIEKLHCNDSVGLSAMCPVETAGMRNTLFSNKCKMWFCVCVCVCVCENYEVVPYTVKINGSCLCTNVMTLFYIKFHCKSFRNLCTMFFRICKSVHHHTFNWINQPDAANSQVYYLSFKYSSTCFWHSHVNHQELQQMQ
jgi:hypothetical protein